MAIYQIAIFYKVLPHAHNVKDFFLKSKFFNTFYKTSIVCQKVYFIIEISHMKNTSWDIKQKCRIRFFLYFIK